MEKWSARRWCHITGKFYRFLTFSEIATRTSATRWSTTKEREPIWETWFPKLWNSWNKLEARMPSLTSSTWSPPTKAVFSIDAKSDVNRLYFFSIYWVFYCIGVLCVLELRNFFFIALGNRRSSISNVVFCIPHSIRKNASIKYLVP